MNRFLSLIFVPIALGVGGCASFHKAPPAPATASPAPVPVTISQAPVHPSVPVYAPHHEEMDPTAIPLILQPEVSVQKVKPWKDSEGRLHFNETIVLIEKQASINPEALRNPSRAYVPVENQPVLPGTGRWAAGSGPVSQGPKSPADNKSKSLWEIYGVENVIVLDLPEYDQNGIAEKMVKHQLGDGYTLVWGGQLGWCAVRSAVLRPVDSKS